MPATTSTSHVLFTCPACGQLVSGTLSLGITLGEVRDKEVDAKATVTGLRVSHDCTPAIPRRGDDYRATWNVAPATREFDVTRGRNTEETR